MKKLAIFFFIFIFVVPCFAQFPSGASATARVVKPVAVSKITDMDFDNGSEIPASITEEEETSFHPTNCPSIFIISGEPNRMYSITLPSTEYTIVRIGGIETMTVNNFKSVPSQEGVLNQNGTQTLIVGATLNIGAKQTPGVYKTNQGGFEIIVNYN